jgi:hypothetical protein
MKTRRFYLGLATVALLATVLAWGCSASTANIGDAWMARDSEGTERTTTFAPSEVFHCLVDLKNAPDDTTVKASWTAVEVEGADPNTFIDEAVLTTGSDSLHFELSNNGLWPNGHYKVDLYLNDKLDRTLEFDVR